MAEVLQHSLLRERAFRSEECHFEGFFLRETCRHDFAKQTHDLFVAQWPVIAIDDFAEYLRFALWTIEIRGVQPLCCFGSTDFLRDTSALVDQRMDLLIE